MYKELVSGNPKKMSLIVLPSSKSNTNMEYKPNSSELLEMAKSGMP
jgi:hypothetical protein